LVSEWEEGWAKGELQKEVGRDEEWSTAQRSSKVSSKGRTKGIYEAGIKEKRAREGTQKTKTLREEIVSWTTSRERRQMGHTEGNLVQARIIE